MATVLLLGAGFSAAFGLPVMGNFFKRAPAFLQSDSAALDLLRQLRLHAENRFGYIEGDTQNIEHVLSLAMSAGPLPGLPDGVEFRIRGILKQVYSSFGTHVSDWRAPELLRRFLGYPHSTRPAGISVVTTNYDVVAEYCFARLGLNLTLPFDAAFAASGRQDRLYSGRTGHTRTGAIYKLHGSVNWQFVGDGIEVQDGLHSRHAIEPEPQFGSVPDCADPTQRSPGDPAIVPPTFFKNSPHPVFEEIRAKAWAELARADKVIVIGYSFPATDPHMRYFFASAIAANTTCERVVIVDLDPERVVQNLTESAAPVGRLLRDRLAKLGEPQSGWTSHTLGLDGLPSIF